VSLAESELYDIAERFGVDLDQVRRDHVISHALASISARARETFLFTGGTMLSRTWLPDLHLSEDIDLAGTPVEAIETVGYALDVLGAIGGGYLPDHSPQTAWMSKPQTRRSSVSVSGGGAP
jgi:hypothetical protein